MPASKKPLKHPHISVDYNDEPFTVVANSIVKLADGIAAMNNSGLTDRAIIVLLHDSTGVNKKEIVKILKAAPLLAERYLRATPEPFLEKIPPLTEMYVKTLDNEDDDEEYVE